MRHSLQLQLLAALTLLLAAFLFAEPSEGMCQSNWAREGKLRSSDGNCRPEQDSRSQMYPNVPLISAAHCYNDGSALCKAIAGRFEFTFNLNTGELKPVGASRWVDSQGFHKRVPVAYTLKGNPLYFDRSLQWARQYTRKSGPINLLSGFEWCRFAIENVWPYKTAFFDHDGVHAIYFFNRQTCIHNTKTGEFNFFNTRFQGTSLQLIDFDLNPVIFAVWDKLANETLLVKHKRLHWQQSGWKLHEPIYDGNGSARQLEIKPIPSNRPCLTCKGQLLFSNSSFKRLTTMCLNDYYQIQANKEEPDRADKFDEDCGLSQTETAVYLPNGQIYEISQHNGHRSNAPSSHYMLKQGSAPLPDSDCKEYKVEFDSYIASTDVLLPKQDREELPRHRLITLLTKNNRAGEVPPFKDLGRGLYPIPKLVMQEAIFVGGNSWDFNETIFNIDSTKLNYVDDIVYLLQCDTILTIFGPLYTEHPAAKFSVEQAAPAGPISNLDVHEPVNAATADRDNNLFFYLRTNYLLWTKYTCNAASLTTAVKQADYFTRFGGSNQPALALSIFQPGNLVPPITEERLFSDVGLYRGSAKPDAPNSDNFPYQDPDVDSGVPAWAWILAFVVFLIIVALSLAGYLRYKKATSEPQPRSFVEQKPLSLNSRLPLSSLLTKRSGMSGTISNIPSTRSGIARRNFRRGNSVVGTARSRSGRSLAPGGQPERRGSKSKSKSRSRSRSRSDRSTSTKRSGLVSRPLFKR